MTATLAQIWRHPIKAHGFENLQQTAIRAGETMPWDRVWAVTHEATKTATGAWARCSNFTRGAGTPGLMAIGAKLDETNESVTLSHPDLPELSFQPDTDADRFLEWITPLMSVDRAAPTGILRATEQGMTDSPNATLSLGNLATLRVLEQKTGRPLDTRRFRLNIWVEGLAPFEEVEWLGKSIRVGGLDFKVTNQISRCAAIKANPDTGRRDADPLAVMNAEWGEACFGVEVMAQANGTVAIGDDVALA
ncbi:MAG: MOSC N-terminal beta barrel domain-containing protein [Pseudomonadota bacterium]